MTLTETKLDVTPLSAHIGAEIRGIDLREVDADTVAAIRRVWLDRKVVFFPGQDLDQRSHLAFASWFGELTEGHPVIPGVDGFPNLFEIDYSKAREVYASYGDVSTPIAAGGPTPGTLTSPSSNDRRSARSSGPLSSPPPAATPRSPISRRHSRPSARASKSSSRR